MNMIKTKISKNIGVLSKVNRNNTTTLRTLYFSFIHPYLNYCTEIWGNAAQVYIKSLNKLQNICCRMLSDGSQQRNTESLYSTLRITPIKHLYKLKLLTYVHKFYNGHLPSALKNLFQRKPSTYNIQTRQSQHLYLPLVKTTKAQKSIVYQAASLWNKLHRNIKTECSYYSFKRQVLQVMKQFE